jgi:hypothetical protein
MPDDDESSALILRDGSRGRPSKKTPKRCRALCEAIKSGLPYQVVCQSVRISVDTFLNWRKSDERFNQAVEFAEAEAIRENLDIIKGARYENWSAAAWLLERRHPQMFAKPELQLSISTSAAAVAANGKSFEIVVVEDLEFMGLRQRSEYTHHPNGGHSIREVETSNVEPQVAHELSGHLSREGASTGIVISRSEHEEIERRSAQLEAEVDKLLGLPSKSEAGVQSGEE